MDIIYILVGSNSSLVDRPGLRRFVSATQAEGDGIESHSLLSQRFYLNISDKMVTIKYEY